MVNVVRLTESPLGLPSVLAAVNGLVTFTVLRWEWATGEEVAALMLAINSITALLWMLVAPWVQRVATGAGYGDGN